MVKPPPPNQEKREERKQRALDHSTRHASSQLRKLRLGHGMQQLRAASHEQRKLQARRFIEALQKVLAPEQVRQLKSSSDSCGMCIAVMGCKDCCELFCTDDAAAASTKPVPKCPLMSDDGESTAAECEEQAPSALLASEQAAGVSTLESEVRDLKKQLAVSASADAAQHAALEHEIKAVGTQVASVLAKDPQKGFRGKVCVLLLAGGCGRQ